RNTSKSKQSKPQIPNKIRRFQPSKGLPVDNSMFDFRGSVAALINALELRQDGAIADWNVRMSGTDSRRCFLRRTVGLAGWPPSTGPAEQTPKDLSSRSGQRACPD